MGDDDEDEVGNKKRTKFLPLLFGQSNATKAMLAVFDDFDGTVLECVKKLQIKSEEKKEWLRLWLRIDDDRNNRMSYIEFIEYFHMDNDMWTRRVFAIMNESYTGVVSFGEFLTFAVKYLVVDKANTIEFCFRLISRRGDCFRADISIIDMEDLKIFIDHAYHNKTLAQAVRRALDVLYLVNKIGDGCIDLTEFRMFCERNPVFVQFTHKFQQHLRKGVFGVGYWATKTRNVMVAALGPIAGVNMFARVNIDAEMFTMLIGDPVIDGQGRPLAPAPAPGTGAAPADDRDEDEDAGAEPLFGLARYCGVL